MTTCPQCHQQTRDGVCPRCNRRTTRSCATCGSPLDARYSFCPACGAPLGRNPGLLIRRLAWLFGIGALVVVVLVAARLSRTPRPTAPAAVTRGIPAPDISAMTPREQADALFTRIMNASRIHDTAQIRFFRPMAIGAFALLDSLDLDARYHLGLIHVMTDDLPAARAQRDTLLQEAPRHLLGLQLSYAIAQRAADTTQMRTVLRDFLDAYGPESASGRPEYADHAATLQNLRQGALAVLDPTQ